MKKIFLTLSAGAAAGILAGILAGSLFIGSHTYPQTFRVISVDHDADIVTLETSTGYLYQMTGAEDWQAGDFCAAIMEDNGTDEIIDDAIIAARYSGY